MILDLHHTNLKVACPKKRYRSQTRTEEQYLSRLVSIEELGGENKYNLSVSTWVEKEDTREKVDITELNERINKIVVRESELRTQIDAIVADLEG